MGLDRSRHLETQHGATVIWVPFDLHPEIPDGGVPLDRLFGGGDDSVRAGAFGRLAFLAEEAGLPFRPPEWVPRTRTVQGLTEWVRRRDPETGARFHHAVFTAYWGEGRDIEDRAVILDIGADAGADRRELTMALDGEDLGALVDASTANAQRIGVTGTPAWLIDRKALVPGAQPPQVFDDVIARLRSQQ